jgi:bifunctional DNA primase/polymerase-like protein/primase-like protein
MPDGMDHARDLAAQGFFVFLVKERGKLPLTEHGFKNATRDEREILHMWDRVPGANIGIDLKRSDAFVIDIDPKMGVDPEDVISALDLDRAKLDIVWTGEAPEPDAEYPHSLAGVRGAHLYFKGHEPTHKTSIDGVEVRGDGAYVVGPGSAHASGVSYEWANGKYRGIEPPETIRRFLQKAQKPRAVAAEVGETIPAGARNATMTSLAGSMRRRGMDSGEIYAALTVVNRRCSPPLPDDELRRVAESVGRYAPVLEPPSPRDAPPVEWPSPLEPVAFKAAGVLDRMWRLFEPATEADAASVLMQLLTAFGNACGRGPHMILGHSRHSLVFYVLIVGRTSSGRKGTSWDLVESLMERVDADWFENRIARGLSSGEGLVFAVRDPTYVRARKDGQKDDDESADDLENFVQRIDDPGVEDKRLLALETEFSQTLRVMRRDTNILSQTIRNLWDSGAAGSLVKHAPSKTTKAHVSIIGHIVREELRREMSDVSLVNGFANRFLFVCSQRAKLLPEPPPIDVADILSIAEELRTAIEWAQDVNLMIFDADAQTYWNHVYTHDLAVERAGVFGSVTARAEPYVARLSMLYALLNGKAIVKRRHLEAAMAIWRYCEASARYLFADNPIINDADRVLRIVQANSGGAMSQTEISNALHHNWESARLAAALETAVAAGRLITETVPTGGRPATVYRLP